MVPIKGIIKRDLFFFLIFSVFIVPIGLLGSEKPMPKVKIISYYEESQLEYQLFLTVYRHGKVVATIKEAGEDVYHSEWNEYTFENTLSKEEVLTFFNPLDSMKWDKADIFPSVPMGGKLFRLEVVLPNKTEIIESKLNIIKSHGKLSVFHREVVTFFRKYLPEANF